jgi:hypothetical protein
MIHRVTRKELLKQISVAGAGLLLDSCTRSAVPNINSDETTGKRQDDETRRKADVAPSEVPFKAGHLDAKVAASKLEQWFVLAASLPISCFSAFVLNGKSLVILVTDFEAPTTELQSLLSKFGTIAKASSTGKPQNLARALTVYYGRQAPLNFRNCSGGLYNSYEDIRGCIVQVMDQVIKYPGLMYQVNTLDGNIAAKGFEAASCYPYRARPFLSELQSYWTSPSQGRALLKGFQQAQRLLLANGVTAHYVNYPSMGFADWQHAYYGANYTRLQAVKHKAA